MIMLARNSSFYNRQDKPLPIYKVRDNSMNSNIILKPRLLNTNVDILIQGDNIERDITQTNFYTYNMIDSLKYTKSCTSCGK